MSTQVDWIATEVCDALPVLHHTYGYLTSHRTSPSPDQYQIILLADRGTCVWTTCPKSLPESVRPETHDLRSRKSNDVTTMPHNTYCETVNSKCREKVLVTLRELYFSQCHGAWCLKCDKKTISWTHILHSFYFASASITMCANYICQRYLQGSKPEEQLELLHWTTKKK